MSSVSRSRSGTWRMVGIGRGMREPWSTLGRSGAIAIRPLLLAREADGLAADGVVLAQGMALPVVLHEDAAEVGVTLDRDAHQVPRLALVPVRGRPHRDDAR